MPSDQSPASTDGASAQKTVWRPQFIRAALEEYVECKAEALQSDNGAFKSTVHTRVAKKIKTDFNVDITVKQLKSKLQDLKKRYTRFDYLRSKSGWGVDPHTGFLTASDEAWEEEIRIHPDSKWHRTNCLMNLHLLEELFTNTIATGRFAVGNIIPASEPNDGNQLSVTDDLISPSASTTPVNLSNSNSQRKRKARNISSVGRKRPKQSYRDEMASAVTSIAKSLNERGKSWSERATELLWEEYGERISVSDGIKIATLFQGEAVAMSFCYMPETARENWLGLENLLLPDNSDQQQILPSDSSYSSEPIAGDTAGEWEIPADEWGVSD